MIPYEETAALVQEIESQGGCIRSVDCDCREVVIDCECREEENRPEVVDSGIFPIAIGNNHAQQLAIECNTGLLVNLAEDGGTPHRLQQ